MKHNYAMKIGLAATLIILPISGFALNSGTDTVQSSGMQQPRGEHEAMRMVSAEAQLVETLDAKKLQPGHTFQAKLVKAVHLDNGPTMPSGTMLVGTIEKDDMQVDGRSKLVLRFSQAKLQTGKMVPIKATIVGVSHPGSEYAGLYAQRDQVPNSWNDGTLQVDQESVLPGVDLHSKISSKNSGVFVSKDKDNVILRTGSEIRLAIAVRNN